MAVAKTAEAAVSASAPASAGKPVRINPVEMVPNNAGQVWTDWFARLPEGATVDDIKNPDIWRQVQGTRGKALKLLDTVLCMAWDQTWFASARVIAADGLGVTLDDYKVRKIESRSGDLYQDDSYRVAWVGNGYTTIRKKDGVRMTGVVHTADVAKADLLKLYPRPAA